MIVVKKKKHRTKTGSSLLNWFGFLEGRGILGGTTTPSSPRDRLSMATHLSRKSKKGIDFALYLL